MRPTGRLWIVLLWAAWSAGTLLLAAAAANLPVRAPENWSRALGAPPLARWDSGWYAAIARDGYHYDPAVRQNDIGFYPLYPLLTRWVARLTGAPLFGAGIALSLACLLAALLLLADLAVAAEGADRAFPALAALLAFPSAFFLAAVYTESLFLLATVGAFWAARRERWWLAGIFGFAAGATRFNGFLIAVPILWLVWETRRRDARWPLRQAPAVLGAVLGAAAFPVYLWLRWGDPLLYVRSKAIGWGKEATPFWTVYRDASVAWGKLTELGGRGSAFFLQLGCAILFIGLTVVLFRRGRTAEGLYAAATLLLLLSSGDLSGTIRFVLALFPCFIVLGEILSRRPVAAFAYLFGGVGLGLVLLHRFVHWMFVG